MGEIMENYNSKLKKYTFLTPMLLAILVTCILFTNSGFNFSVFEQSRAGAAHSVFKEIILKISRPQDADSVIKSYFQKIYPLISENEINKIAAKKSVDHLLNDNRLYVSFTMPEYYLETSPVIVWQLNLPELKTRFFHIYQGDTVLIDKWDCSIGDPRTRTFTGHYKVLKIRNYPFWKDPDTDSPPVPPGPLNPLGLFTIHFDEKSTRQFHGTNIDNVQINSYGAVSHGCIRNDNDNIAKLKEFMIRKIIKSRDLSLWRGSKQTMAYDLKPEDKLPFVIIYKTFDIDKDEDGYFITFFKDFYHYETNPPLDPEDSSLIITSTIENILNEFNWKYRSVKISNEKLIPILLRLIYEHENWEKYYFKDLISGFDRTYI